VTTTCWHVVDSHFGDYHVLACVPLAIPLGHVFAPLDLLVLVDDKPLPRTDLLEHTRCVPAHAAVFVFPQSEQAPSSPFRPTPPGDLWLRETRGATRNG